MADPQRAPAPAEGDDRVARIEQLLIAGLDRYFAGNYEQAIDLWTRVLFLDRHHDRARAYIERARSAQAERQRESEALLHEGLAAFDRGDVERARHLLSSALDRGVASDEAALGVLSRLRRLEPRAAGTPAGRAAAAPPPSRISPGAGGRRQPAFAREGSARAWWPAGVGVVMAASVAAGWLLLEGPAREWARWPGETAGARASVPTPAAGPLAVPLSSESHLLRARALYRAGRVRDALRELDRVGIGDALRPQADRLRAELQRALLDLVRVASEPQVAAPQARDE